MVLVKFAFLGGQIFSWHFASHLLFPHHQHQSHPLEISLEQMNLQDGTKITASFITYYPKEEISNYLYLGLIVVQVNEIHF